MALPPVVEPAPTLSGRELLRRLQDAPGAYLLDSGGDHDLARFVLAGAFPTGHLCIRQGQAAASAWSALADATRPRVESGPPWPTVRAVGLLSYEVGALCDRFPPRRGPATVPDVLFAEYDAGYVLDRASRRAWIWGETRAAARRLATRLAGPGAPLPTARLARLTAPDPARYLRAVSRVLDYIAAGDIYQANISRRFDAHLDGSSAALYAALRASDPAPFAAYLDLGELQILSLSPERYLRFDPESGLVETRPIKGTAARAACPDEDLAAAAALATSPKDRAEHVMIVDLERNDLGRVCRTGSVRVDAFARVESFARVHHLVSVVRGRLADGASLSDVLRASFPSGSITGAPKVRAMEVIAEVEGAPRGPAFGAFGYIDRCGRADLALAIRTAVVTGDRVSYAAGAGIVADSDPVAELAEVELKARSFLGLLDPSRARAAGEAQEPHEARRAPPAHEV